MYTEYDLVKKDKQGNYTGSIFGYATKNMNFLKTFIEKYIFINFKPDTSNIKSIGLINTLFVEENKRSCGIGRELMEELLSKFRFEHQVERVFVVCDKSESNHFDLREWYQSFGFSILEDTQFLTLMELRYEV